MFMAIMASCHIQKHRAIPDDETARRYGSWLRSKVVQYMRTHKRSLMHVVMHTPFVNDGKQNQRFEAYLNGMSRTCTYGGTSETMAASMVVKRVIEIYTDDPRDASRYILEAKFDPRDPGHFALPPVQPSQQDPIRIYWKTNHYETLVPRALALRNASPTPTRPHPSNSMSNENFHKALRTGKFGGANANAASSARHGSPKATGPTRPLSRAASRNLPRLSSANLKAWLRANALNK